MHIYEQQYFIIGDLNLKKPAPIMAKDGHKNEKAIKNYLKIIYQFHYKENLLFEYHLPIPK